MKHLTVIISKELHKKFKQYALRHDTTMTKIITKFIETILEEEKITDANA